MKYVVRCFDKDATLIGTIEQEIDPALCSIPDYVFMHVLEDCDSMPSMTNSISIEPVSV